MKTQAQNYAESFVLGFCNPANCTGFAPVSMDFDDGSTWTLNDKEKAEANRRHEIEASRKSFDENGVAYPTGTGSANTRTIIQIEPDRDLY